MSVAHFIAAQRTVHRVPHAKCCRWLGVSESWFYKWHDTLTPSQRQHLAWGTRCSVLWAAMKCATLTSLPP